MLQSPHPLRVLIADDSARIREVLVAILSEVPRVELIGEVETAPDALAAVRRLRPDVLVLDISMPGGSGIDVLASVKKEMPGVIVIMMTLTNSMREICEGMGADYFFDKAGNINEFIATVANLTRGSAVVKTGGLKRPMPRKRAACPVGASVDAPYGSISLRQLGTACH